MKMKRVALFIFLIFWGFFQAGYGQGSETRYDVEYARICLIDSIAPDTLVQFWRFTQSNNPGALTLDYQYDLSSGYTVAGTVLPCCSCLTAASDTAGFSPCQPTGIGWGWKIAIALVLLVVASWWINVLGLLEFGRRYQKAARIAYFLLISILFSYSSLSAQSETTYDVEYECICLIDSIAPDTLVQFWRFTQSNNPGALTLDYQYDLSSGYTVVGTVMGCNEYYLGDNVNTGGGTAGTLPIWTGANALGNSSLTEGSGVLSSSLTGALKLPAGTDAQDPVWSAGMLRYNTTVNGLQGYDGTAERFLPWADADNWTNTYIPYSSGSTLTTSNDFRWTGGLSIGSPPTLAASNRTLSVKSTDLFASFYNSANTEKVRINSDGSYVFQNATSGQKLQWGSGSKIEYSTATTDRWVILDSQSGGSAGAWTFKAGATQLAQIGLLRIGRYDTHNNNSLFGVSFPALYGHSDLSPMVISGYQPPTSDAYNGGSIIISGGRSSGTNSNSGSLFLRNGTQNASGSNSTGIIGKVKIQVYKDSTAVAVAPTLYDFFVFDGGLNWHFLQRKQTTTGIQTLTMEADTVKYRIENLGAISTTTDASGDVTVTHGMGTTPTSVQVTITGTTPYVVTVHTIGSTNFTVRFFDMAGVALNAVAVTATWHAKT
jgi:hypothetical protein